jgi:ABC-type Fe3+ transport system permease subunit
VRLFDGHAGGLPLAESLRRAAAPFAVEAAVLGVALAALARQRWERAGAANRSATGAVAGWCLLAVANILVWVVPAVVVLQGTAQGGWRALAQSFGLSREIATSLLVGGAAGAMAYALSPQRWWSAVAACIPGLLGPLVLSLVVAAGMQSVWLYRWRDTPAPLVVTLALLLLPIAVLLRQLLRRTAGGGAVHAARLLGGRSGRRLVWDLSTRRHMWAIFLLVCLGYLDLTASAILAPIGMTPVSVRLYNLMHYGRTAVLSAMLAAAFAAPLAIPLAVTAARRVWMRL